MIEYKCDVCECKQVVENNSRVLLRYMEDKTEKLCRSCAKKENVPDKDQIIESLQFELEGMRNTYENVDKKASIASNILDKHAKETRETKEMFIDIARICQKALEKTFPNTWFDFHPQDMAYRPFDEVYLIQLIDGTVTIGYYSDLLGGDTFYRIPGVSAGIFKEVEMLYGIPDEDIWRHINITRFVSNDCIRHNEG